MEFLDKEGKRKRTIQLFTGYALVAILIGLATTILVYLAQGYNYSLDDGVVQNGLAFVESKPVSATVYVDGQKEAKTSAKLSLSEGRHLIELKQPKYRDWSKSFNLEGGSVRYFLYPKLIPVDIEIGVTKVFDTAPAWVSQSLDRRWLVLQQNIASPVLTIIDLANPSDEPVMSTLPVSQLSGTNGNRGTLSPVEWASDNKHLLLKQTLSDTSSTYIVFDRENADNSVNVSTKFNLAVTGKLTLRDKKFDKYYYLDSATKELRILDLSDGLDALPLLTSVEAYKSFGNNLVLYVTYELASTENANVFVLNNKEDKYLLKSITRDTSGKYLLDMAQYENNWYYVTASGSGDEVYMYRNPLKRAKAGNTQPINPQMSLALKNPQFVSFSDNTRFIGMQSAKNFTVFDSELNNVYRFTSPLDINLAQQAKWMDGHRFSVVVAEKVKIFEFDGTNLQELTASAANFSAYFDKNYQHVYTLVQQANGKTGFENGKLFVD